MSDSEQNPDHNEADLLNQAAAACGIELSYFDVWGNAHTTPPDVLKETLQRLDIQTGSPAEIQQSLDRRAARYWRQPLDPTLVVLENADSIEVRISADRKGASIKLEIEWEPTGSAAPELEHHWFWLPEMQTLDSCLIDGQEFLAKRLPLPKSLRLGYHRVRIIWMQQPQQEVFGEARFIVCPHRALPVERRLAGLALSLYGLRSQQNWGCGDFTDLRKVIDAFAPAGAAFIALNPLHALANRQPYNISPYLPECAFYRNFIYLDVDKVAKETGGGLRLSEETSREIDELRASEFVEYERIAKLKRGVLTQVFERFLANGGSSDFDQYNSAAGSLLEDYAVYCALWEEMHGRDENVWLWTAWPELFRDPRSAETAAFAKEHAQRVMFFKFLQWQLALQASETHAYALSKGMPIGLYHDLALATDRWGADLWAHRPFYIPGAKVGAPPDALAPSGQDWGFPPPDSEQHRANGYRLFAESIRSAAFAGGALRMDHVMRFFHLYWIPENSDATRGTYVRDRPQELLGIIALESHRNGFVVIGEDLGTVTDEVRRVLFETGVLSYRLLMFEQDGAGRFRAPDEYPPHALVCTTTHDLPTLAGFAAYRDIDARKAAGLADEAAFERQKSDRAREIANMAVALEAAGFKDDPLGFVLATPCLLAAVNQEDLTGELYQQNLPGSTWQYPNWRRKMMLAVEELEPIAKKFGDAVKRSGRAF